uniref:Uncharacterized protein n=1 Tax=Stegastes partitus TaxID=144197 RepID=A0A3B4Z685_9TELE
NNILQYERLSTSLLTFNFSFKLTHLCIVKFIDCKYLQHMQSSYPGLQFLELLLATLHGQVLSLIQTVLQVLDCDLQVLLHPLQVSAGLNLHLIQSALHGVNHPLAVPLDLLHLLVLLCQLPVNLTFDLVQLKLNTENLGLLMLQGALWII